MSIHCDLPCKIIHLVSNCPNPENSVQGKKKIISFPGPDFGIQESFNYIYVSLREYHVLFFRGKEKQSMVRVGDKSWSKQYEFIGNIIHQNVAGAHLHLNCCDPQKELDFVGVNP